MAEVRDKAHILNTLRWECWWNIVLAPVLIDRVKQFYIKKAPKPKTDIRKTFDALGKGVERTTY
jgi:hypothetical protein